MPVNVTSTFNGSAWSNTTFLHHYFGVTVELILYINTIQYVSNNQSCSLSQTEGINK